MSLNVTHFEYADRGRTSTYKFTVADDPAVYVWFEYEDGSGLLCKTPVRGPYDPAHTLEVVKGKDLDALLAERGTTKEQWVADLMAQYGERLGWRYRGEVVPPAQPRTKPLPVE